MTKGITAVLIVVSLVILTGAVLIGTGTISPFSKPGSGDVIEEALIDFLKAESFRADGSLTLTADTQTDQGPQQASLSFGFSNAIDALDKDLLKDDLLLDVEIKTEGMSFSATLGSIIIGKDFYFQLSNLPPFLPLPIDLTEIEDQWFLFNMEDVGAILGIELDPTFGEGLGQAEDEFLSVIKGKGLFEVKENMGEDEVGDHYLVSLNKGAVKKMGPEILEFAKKYATEEQRLQYETEAQEVIEEFPGQIDVLWAQTGGVEFEVWIKGSLLRKILWQKKIAIDTTAEMLEMIPESGAIKGDLNVVLEAQFSDFNKDFNIEAPAQATPFEELLGLIFGSFAEPVAETE